MSFERLRIDWLLVVALLKVALAVIAVAALLGSLTQLSALILYYLCL